METTKTKTPAQHGKTPLQNPTAAANPFRPSGRTRRSPVGLKTTLGIVRSTPTAVEVRDPEETPRSTQQKNTDQEQANQVATEVRTSSPRQEFILKMRTSEEETMERCREVLKKIRQAMTKQRNISMDVQTGVSELEELLDILGEYRRNWKTAEVEKGNSRILAARTVHCTEDSESASSMPQKRIATSPAETPNPGKKQKDIAQNNGVQKVTRPNTEEGSGKENANTLREKPETKKKGRGKMPRQRPEAVIIRPAEGHSYADVLRKLKNTVKPEDSEVTIRTIRKTRAGAILLELAQRGKMQQFSETIKESLKESAEVRGTKQKATIEIRDIDCTSTEEEVIGAVCMASESTEDDITVRLTNLNSRDQRRAYVVLPTNAAKTILRLERIKIGWTSCRVRYRDEDRRCFKCFGLGHGQWECKGPDRKAKGLCIRCGEEGHFLKQCKNPPKCCICTEQNKSPTDHLPGSRSCKADRQV